MALELKIATGGNVPLYRQLADQVRRAVASGQLQPGEQLPSVRALAEQLVINPNTVAKTYNELVQEGVLQSHAGKGLFVAERRQKFSDAERARRLEAALQTFLNEILFLDFTSEEILERLREHLEATQLSAPTNEENPHA